MIKGSQSIDVVSRSAFTSLSVIIYLALTQIGHVSVEFEEYTNE